MNKVFKTRHFSRWMRKTELTDKALCDAVLEMMNGLIDADLGGGIIKKRVGIAGKGKRGGARTVLATFQDYDKISSISALVSFNCRMTRLQ